MTEVAVAFGGPSPEHDVSILTGLQAVRSLGTGRDGGKAGNPAQGAARALYWSKTGDWFLVDSTLEARDFLEGVPRKAKRVDLRLGSEGGFFEGRRRLGTDAVVNCCHGGPGEDGTLQAAFDLAGVPYTGPSQAGAALGMDKLAFGAAASAVGLPTVPRIALTASGPVADSEPEFAPPFLVKPRFGGSSIGIEVVEDLATARDLAAASPHLRQGAVMEPFLAGSRDVNVAIRTWPELSLSAIEEPHRTGTDGTAILTFEDKYMQGSGLAGAARDLPADVPEPVAEAIRSAATRVATALGVRGVARLDFLLGGDRLYVNEINTIPGLLSSYLWIDPPVTFAQLLDDLVAEATQGQARRFSATGADGALLRSAESIAAKLGL